MDSNGKVSMHPAMYRRALHRECIEETDFDIDTLPPNDVYELSPVADQPSYHKNFVIFCRNPLYTAYPQPDNRWEMEKWGVSMLIDVHSVRGGYHAWAPLSWLVTHLKLMEPCRAVISLLINKLPSENLCPWSDARSSVNYTSNSSSASSASVNFISTKVRSKIQYAENFEALPLREPIQEKPFDVLRTHIGRLKKVWEMFWEEKN